MTADHEGAGARWGRVAGSVLGSWRHFGFPAVERVAVAHRDDPAALVLARLLDGLDSLPAVVLFDVGDDERDGSCAARARSACAGTTIELIAVEERRYPGGGGVGGVLDPATRTAAEEAELRGISVLALADTATDVAERWLEGALYEGQGLRTAPEQDVLGGAVTLVRPLLEVERETMTVLVSELFPDVRQQAGGGERRQRARAALEALGHDRKRAVASLARLAIELPE